MFIYHFMDVLLFYFIYGIKILLDINIMNVNKALNIVVCRNLTFMENFNYQSVIDQHARGMRNPKFKVVFLC